MIRRHITEQIQAALKDTPVVFLAGARQTGKSTLARWLVQNGYPAQYVTLDDLTALSAAKSDPEGFLSGFEGPLVLDEVQRAPELFLALKKSVDSDRRPGRFLLTGSANVLLLPRLSESLAGRMKIIRLLPFSQGELRGKRETFIDRIFANKFKASGGRSEKAKDIFCRALVGGYPEAVRRKSPARRRAWFGSYITTMIERDIRDLSHIEGLTALPGLFHLLATRVASLLNYSDLSRSLGMPQTTLKRYMTLLQSSFLVETLPPWSANIGKRLVKTPKVYLNDTGLLAYLLGLTEQRLADEPASCGALLENFVLMELVKQSSWSLARVQFFHFRSHAGDEVDIVLEEDNGRLTGIEIKASSAVRSDDFRGLRLLAEATGRRFCRGIVVYNGDKTVPFGDSLYAAPVSELWTA
ncbi:MAG: ATP-binding protein [Planctomycetota bacterium]